jgi:hypothetical protein
MIAEVFDGTVRSQIIRSPPNRTENISGEREKFSFADCQEEEMNHKRIEMVASICFLRSVANCETSIKLTAGWLLVTDRPTD